MSDPKSEIVDKLIKHDVNLLRLSAGSIKTIAAMLGGLREEALRKINKLDPSSVVRVQARNKRMNYMIGLIANDIDKVYAHISLLLESELAKIAGTQVKVVTSTINSVITIELVSGRLSRDLLVSLAKNTLIEGAPSAEWWQDQADYLKKLFAREIREGVLLSESVPDLIRRVRGRREHGFKDGIMSMATRKAAVLVRSSIMAVANEARLATFQVNSDVIKGVRWTSTLDSRVSPTCQALDGQAWALDGKRLPGTTLKWRGPPPAHWGCRSTLIPVLKSWSELTKSPTIKKRLSSIEGIQKADLRASMDGAVPGDLNYEQWLRMKPESFQLEVLGPTKLELWRKGLIAFTDIVDQSHHPLSIRELLDTV